MDSIPQYPAVDFSSMAMRGVGVSSVDPTLRLNSHVCDSPGNKRKSLQADGSMDLQDNSSLVLGLGHSSSCITMSSGKETQESYIDLDLSINLQSQNDGIAKHKKAFYGLEVEKSKLDLELSLSTEPADSSVTVTLTEGFFPFQNNVEPLTIGCASGLMDEGSISSRWKLWNLVPQSHSSKSLDVATHSDCTHTPASSNISSAAVTTPRSSGTSIFGFAQQQRRNTSAKSCQFAGCTRGARGASGLCISHGGGRRCQRLDCQKGAEGKTVFCKAHGGGKRCQHLGCVKSAEGRTDFCISHGGGRRCSYESCPRAARGKSGRCIRHGGGKRCNMDNCSKSAEGITGFCISHGGGRRCQYPDCGKGAQGSTNFCKAHGGGKRCTFLGCTKGAEGSTPFCKGHGGGKRCSFETGCSKSVHGGTLYCVNHGGGKRCVEPGCTKSARGRTDFCVRHGGGRRCQYEECGKSAQGSTDFCKAHGGGRRCSWGQLGAESGPCDKIARGKNGLCVAHSSQEQSNSVVHALERTIGENNSESNRVTSSVGFLGYEHHRLIPVQVQAPLPIQFNRSIENSSNDFSLPEGRVHGGNLMAMLRGGASLESKQ